MSAVIVGYGKHDHATAALRWGVDAARVLERDLRVVTVFEQAYAEMPPDQFDELVKRQEQDVIAQLALAEAAGDRRTAADHVVILQGDPLEAFATYVEDHDEALVVVGAESRSGPGELGSGTPAHHLLRHLSAPLAIIRPGYAPLAGGTIVVGVDGSEANAACLHWAAELAAKTEGRVVAVFAHDPIDDTFDHPKGWHRHSDDVRAEIDQVTSVSIELLMEPGHPVEVLIDVARRAGAAAIIAGTRGHGGFAGLQVGRVPRQLVDHSPCPVIVVPHNS
jgi:nucleotide-binding universal stress UspA family protein